MLNILVVEDEANIADIVCLTLRGAGYACETAADGEAAADLLEQKTYDLVLLDIMLPKASGFELMEYIAPTGTPVIFLTAKADVRDKVRGLKMGADDYIVKPFQPPELAARVESVLRRAGKGSTVLHAFDVELDAAARTVKKDGRAVALTPGEYALLEVLMRNRGIALYRDALFERVWGGLREDTNRTLDLHILRLRKKLCWQHRIKTVFKVGYMLERDA